MTTGKLGGMRQRFVSDWGICPDGAQDIDLGALIGTAQEEARAAVLADLDEKVQFFKRNPSASYAQENATEALERFAGHLRVQAENKAQDTKHLFPAHCTGGCGRPIRKFLTGQETPCTDCGGQLCEWCCDAAKAAKKQSNP